MNPNERVWRWTCSGLDRLHCCRFLRRMYLRAFGFHGPNENNLRSTASFWFLSDNGCHSIVCQCPGERLHCMLLLLWQFRCTCNNLGPPLLRCQAVVSLHLMHACSILGPDPRPSPCSYVAGCCIATLSSCRPTTRKATMTASRWGSTIAGRPTNRLAATTRAWTA